MLLTSQRTPASVKRAVELGADDYLVKPIDASLVIKKCHDLLGNASSLSGFPTISVDIPLVIPKSPFDVKIKMTKLSEIGAELESAVRLKDNAVIDLYSDKLPKELSDIEDFRIRFKVKDVVEWNDTFNIEGVFVGLPEKMAKHIRALAIKGVTRTDDAA